jgi:hypothetical protein
VEDGVDPLDRPEQAIAVAHVADQEADVPPRAVALPLVELLGLIAPEDAHDLGLESEEMIDEAGTDRAGAAGDQDAATPVGLGECDLPLLVSGHGQPGPSET